MKPYTQTDPAIPRVIVDETAAMRHELDSIWSALEMSVALIGGIQDLLESFAFAPTMPTTQEVTLGA